MVKRYARLDSGIYISSDGVNVAPLDAAPWHGGTSTGQGVDTNLRLACPVAPGKILCVARNYRAHAAELDNEAPSSPLFFEKPISSLLPNGGAVVLPRESSRVDYEAELAVVIGQRARRIGRDEAPDAIFGFTIACDVTARDLQKKDGQWTRAKGFDTFCPLGPSITRGVNPNDLEVRLWINDELRQHGSTSQMIFDPFTLIAAASQFLTLQPGDLILTGTPAGVGPLSAGDVVRITISGLEELCFDVQRETE